MVSFSKLNEIQSLPPLFRFGALSLRSFVSFSSFSPSVLPSVRSAQKRKIHPLSITFIIKNAKRRFPFFL